MSFDRYSRRVLRTIVTIAIIALLIIGAGALGLKFFNTSVREQEDERGWDDDDK